MWPSILLALEVEARDGTENLEPGRSVAPNFDLRFDWPKRVDCLIEQIPHDARLRLIPRGPDIANRQVIVNAHVTLDEAGHMPRLRRSVEAFEDEDVAAAGGAPIALATALMIGVSQRRTDPRAQRFNVACLGRADAICQTSFFHAGSRRTA